MALTRSCVGHWKNSKSIGGLEGDVARYCTLCIRSGMDTDMKMVKRIGCVKQGESKESDTDLHNLSKVLDLCVRSGKDTDMKMVNGIGCDARLIYRYYTD